MIYVSNMGGTQVLKPGANCEYLMDTFTNYKRESQSFTVIQASPVLCSSFLIFLGDLLVKQW